MTPLLLSLFTFSGMCALIYQLIWVRWFGLILGNFAIATCVVVTTFMGGLALGSSAIGRTVTHRSPRSALALYGCLEGGLALLGALSPLVITTESPLYPFLAAASANQVWGGLLCAGLLVPPTFLMGATLPAMVQVFSATAPRALGRLYSLNTLGGALGPLLAAFLLLPRFGFKTTLWMACGVNVLVSGCALLVAHRWRVDRETIPARANPQTPLADLTVPASFPYLLAGASGFVALGYEMALNRFFVLTITGGSVYGLAITLSTFLLGLASGALLVRIRPPHTTSSALLAFALAQGIVWLFTLTTPFWDRLPEHLVRVWWSPLSFELLSALNFAVILLLTLSLTTAFGFALPVLVASLPAASSSSIGRIFAANTLGAVIGALLTGFVSLRLLGLGVTLLTLGVAALLVAGCAVVLARPKQMVNVLVSLPLLAAMPFALPSHDDSVMNAGMYNRPSEFQPTGQNQGVSPRQTALARGRVIYQKDSLTARVAVLSSSMMHLSYVVNGKPDGSTNLGDMYTQVFMAHLPALAHADPQNALVIGLGTGITAGSLALHPSIQRVEVIEIEPAQLEVARIFAHFNHRMLENPRVRIHLDDARRFLLSDTNAYDLLVSEPSNLWVSGMVNLFTREFYEMARRRLNPGGIFFQWIHYYRVSEADLRGMLRTFQSVFPDATLWIHPFGDAFLLARNGDLTFDIAAWTERMAAADLRRDLKRLDLEPTDLPGFFLWSPDDIQRYAGSAPLCTDDFPYLEFTTPRAPHVGWEDFEALRQRMQLFGPLEPMPLAVESEALRLDLGDRFLSRGSISRAEAEYQRALHITRVPARVRRKLAELEEARRKNEVPRGDRQVH